MTASSSITTIKWVLMAVAIMIAVAAMRNFEVVHEYFQDALTTEDNLMEEQIVRVYLDVLGRQPSSKELIADSRNIKKGALTLKGLRQRLVGTDEYARSLKTQSNALAPELDKMLSDQTMLNTISEIYQEERGTSIPSALVLPYRDIYIELEYNEYTFRAFLRAEAYPTFEHDLERDVANMSRQDVIDLFNKSFKKDELVKAGVAIRKEMEAKAAAAAGPAAAGALCADRSLADKDSDMSRMIASILKDSDGVFDKDAVAKTLDAIQKIQNDPNMSDAEKAAAIKAIIAMANQDAMNKAIASNAPLTDDDANLLIPMTHEGDMVLRPEFAWSVPQRRAPVCNTLGQRPLVQPVMTNSSLLLGTPLDTSIVDTQVGSIMPKFVYQRYVEVPVPGAACKAKN
jgi:hypothetical protein